MISSDDVLSLLSKGFFPILWIKKRTIRKGSLACSMHIAFHKCHRALISVNLGGAHLLFSALLSLSMGRFHLLKKCKNSLGKSLSIRFLKWYQGLISVNLGAAHLLIYSSHRYWDPQRGSFLLFKNNFKRLLTLVIEHYILQVIDPTNLAGAHLFFSFLQHS